MPQLVSLGNYPGNFLPLLLSYAYAHTRVNTSTPSFHAETCCICMNIICKGNINQILD